MNVLDKIRNALTINPSLAFPIASLALGYRTVGEFDQHYDDYDPTDDKHFTVRRWGASVTLGSGDEECLYWNAVFFARVNFPFGVWIGMRVGHDRVFQCGLGWKLSGVPGGNFRVQTDDSSAAGTTGYNSGQARGWWKGPH